MENVLHIIEDNLDTKEQQLLIQRLQIPTLQENQSFSQKLTNIPWQSIELQLKLLKKCDTINQIKKTTLITEGINYKFLFCKIS